MRIKRCYKDSVIVSYAHTFSRIVWCFAKMYLDHLSCESTTPMMEQNHNFSCRFFFCQPMPPLGKSDTTLVNVYVDLVVFTRIAGTS